MTDAEFQVQKDRISALAANWLGPLGLLWWRVDIEYCRDSAMFVNGSYCTDTIGKAHVMFEYLSATITFNMHKVVGLDDEDLENAFVHECCHVLVRETREWCQTTTLSSDALDAAMKHEERVVCTLASAFIWTRKAGAGTLDLNVPEFLKREKIVQVDVTK